MHPARAWVGKTLLRVMAFVISYHTCLVPALGQMTGHGLTQGLEESSSLGGGSFRSGVSVEAIQAVFGAFFPSSCRFCPFPSLLDAPPGAPAIGSLLLFTASRRSLPLSSVGNTHKSDKEKKRKPGMSLLYAMGHSGTAGFS
ncbi:hypothetical protein LY78DRAFT_325458 [Colletotrichum sublineola]|nr:hypothetical protein LY78DRAFT_325458 [Colletotrichum sublineola]